MFELLGVETGRRKRWRGGEEGGSQVTIVFVKEGEVGVFFYDSGGNPKRGTRYAVGLLQLERPDILQYYSQPTRRRLSCLPTVVFLFSSSLNPRCSGIGHWLLYHTLVHDYGDLEKAIAYLRTHEWIPLVIAVIAEVGGIVHDRASGVTLTDQQGSPLISYPDVAQAMVLMEEDDKWIGKAVGMVVNEGRPIEANGAALLRYLLPNLLATLCPPLWRLGRNYWA